MSRVFWMGRLIHCLQQFCLSDPFSPYTYAYTRRSPKLYSLKLKHKMLSLSKSNLNATSILGRIHTRRRQMCIAFVEVIHIVAWNSKMTKLCINTHTHTHDCWKWRTSSSLILYIETKAITKCSKSLRQIYTLSYKATETKPKLLLIYHYQLPKGCSQCFEFLCRNTFAALSLHT